MFEYLYFFRNPGNSKIIIISVKFNTVKKREQNLVLRELHQLTSGRHIWSYASHGKNLYQNRGHKRKDTGRNFFICFSQSLGSRLSQPTYTIGVHCRAVARRTGGGAWPFSLAKYLGPSVKLSIFICLNKVGLPIASFYPPWNPNYDSRTFNIYTWKQYWNHYVLHWRNSTLQVDENRWTVWTSINSPWNILKHLLSLNCLVKN